MNSTHLPPPQNSFNPPSNGFPSRPNPNVPIGPPTKNGPPPVSSPSPNFGSSNAPPGQDMARGTLAGNPSVLHTYLPNIPQQNGQQFIKGNAPPLPQSPYLGNNEHLANNPSPQARPGLGPPGPQPSQFIGGGPQMVPQKPGQYPNASTPSSLPPQMPQKPIQQQPQMPPLPQQGVPPRTGQIPSSLAGQHVPGMPPMPGQPPSMPVIIPPGSQILPGPPIQNNMQSRPPMPGQMLPPQSHIPAQGQIPHVQGQLPPHQGQMPPHQGQIPPNQGQIPPHQGQMPPLPSQMPPQGQMPPLSNRMPPLVGQGPPMQPGHIDSTSHMANQMQNMSLSGARPGPQMPPPLNNQNYMQQQQRPMQQGPPGYPPMGQPGIAGGYSQPAQQQKRLDPDQMPSPIQVIQDDQKTRSGVFVTNQKGLVPPLVTTNFVVQDQGNASPRYIRSTMYNVPISQDIMKQTAVPFSLVISPMARLEKDEYQPPIVNFGELGPVRCIRCKAYMCPFMQFIDSGRRFQCLFCKATTDVPAEYFQHLDHTGQRLDKYERPELVLGTYEFVATADYCRNNMLPKPPAVIFLIDVSYNNIKSGLVSLICSRMKEIIQNLPVDQGQDKSNMRVGFITYNSSVHFYNIKGTLAGPQMMVVGDTQEMFMPLLDGFLSTPQESEAVIDALMEQIPTMFAETKETEIVLLPAILAGLEALKASETVGKLMVFHSTLPTAECPGKLRNRDDRKLLGTDKEKTVLTPQTQAYNQLGQDCVASGCSVDFFIFNNSYIDLATISQVSRLTGGEVFKYTYFQADIDGDRLVNDIITDISRPIAFDSVMRVRTSTGIRPTDFYGYFYMSNTTDMELAALDCDKGLAIEIKHDDKLSEEEGVYIQAALLYTACSGQRRLRIMNLSLKTCSQMADLYRSCDLDTLINFMAKQATYRLLDSSPKAVKDALVNRGAQILATYRKNCATPSSAGQLILPECMKLLPLYVNCLLKSDALSGGSDMTIDDRAFAMQVVLTMDVLSSVNHFYPRLIPVHEIDLSTNPLETPAPIRCTVEKMNEQGVYILDNGIHMFLWVGLGASPEFVQNVFGAPSAIQIDIERPSIPELDNPLSLAVRKIIDDIRIERHRFMRLTIVRQREKLEPVFKHFLVEDRGTDGSASYVDFLCHMHKEIRSLLS
ncbi:protein transport protein Sec24C [Euwallacea similis]|uniref:protein transport protein Sec24C n=1 Tax=Euwallacea similis TaxID=1736056 RepID=UPI00344CCACF